MEERDMPSLSLRVAPVALVRDVVRGVESHTPASAGGRQTMRINPSRAAVAAAAWLLASAGLAQAGTINIGAGSDYGLLFEGLGGNTLQITNTTVNGNVGVGNNGQANLGGPGTISGRIDFFAPNTGQLSGSNVTVGGGGNYNVAAVAAALNTGNNLNISLGGV